MEYKNKFVPEALNNLGAKGWLCEEFDFFQIKYEDWVSDKEKPTLEEVKAEIERLEQEEIANQYKEDRKKKYLPLEEQLDSLYHAIDQGLLGEEAKTSDFYLNNKAVKDEFPKSEQ